MNHKVIRNTQSLLNNDITLTLALVNSLLEYFINLMLKIKKKYVYIRNKKYAKMPFLIKLTNFKNSIL